MVKEKVTPRATGSKAASSSKSSASSNLPPLVASLFERLEGQESDGNTQKRKRSRNLDETLAKVLRGNFRCSSKAKPRCW